MITLIIYMVMLLAIFGFGGWALDAVKSKRSIASDKKLQVTDGREYDAEGHAVEFEVHYARQLELDNGMKPTVQCENEACTFCYWKARKMMDRYPFPKNYLGHNLEAARVKFINELDDNMSDDFYDLMMKDWFTENDSRIKAAKVMEKDETERARKVAVERHYATRYEDVDKYIKEGRVYSARTNSWSEKGVVHRKSDARPKEMSRPGTGNVWDERIFKKKIQLYNNGLMSANELRAELARLGMEITDAFADKVKRIEVEFIYDIKDGDYWMIEYELGGLQRVRMSRTKITKEFYNANRSHK